MAVKALLKLWRWDSGLPRVAFWCDNESSVNVCTKFKMSKGLSQKTRSQESWDLIDMCYLLQIEEEEPVGEALLQENKRKSTIEWVKGHADAKDSGIKEEDYTTEIKANIICDGLAGAVPCEIRESADRTKQREGTHGFRIYFNDSLSVGNVRRELERMSGEQRVAAHMCLKRWGIATKGKRERRDMVQKYFERVDVETSKRAMRGMMDRPDMNMNAIVKNKVGLSVTGERIGEKFNKGKVESGCLRCKECMDRREQAEKIESNEHATRCTSAGCLVALLNLLERLHLNALAAELPPVLVDRMAIYIAADFLDLEGKDTHEIIEKLIKTDLYQCGEKRDDENQPNQPGNSEQEEEMDDEGMEVGVFAPGKRPYTIQEKNQVDMTEKSEAAAVQLLHGEQEELGYRNFGDGVFPRWDRVMEKLPDRDKAKKHLREDFGRTLVTILTERVGEALRNRNENLYGDETTKLEMIGARCERSEEMKRRESKREMRKTESQQDREKKREKERAKTEREKSWFDFFEGKSKNNSTEEEETDEEEEVPVESEGTAEMRRHAMDAKEIIRFLRGRKKERRETFVENATFEQNASRARMEELETTRGQVGAEKLVECLTTEIRNRQKRYRSAKTSRDEVVRGCVEFRSGTDWGEKAVEELDIEITEFDKELHLARERGTRKAMSINLRKMQKVDENELVRKLRRLEGECENGYFPRAILNLFYFAAVQDRNTEDIENGETKRKFYEEMHRHYDTEEIKREDEESKRSKEKKGQEHDGRQRLRSETIEAAEKERDRIAIQVAKMNEEQATVLSHLGKVLNNTTPNSSTPITSTTTSPTKKLTGKRKRSSGNTTAEANFLSVDDQKKADEIDKVRREMYGKLREAEEHVMKETTRANAIAADETGRREKEHLQAKEREQRDNDQRAMVTEQGEENSNRNGAAARGQKGRSNRSKEKRIAKQNRWKEGKKRTIKM